MGYTQAWDKHGHGNMGTGDKHGHGNMGTGDQHGPGNMGTGSTWAQDQHRHGINTGMETQIQEQHGHGNMGMGATWAWEHGHRSNMGMVERPSDGVPSR